MKKATTASMRGKVILINIAPKLWRPKQINKFISIDTNNDIVDSPFHYKQYENTIVRPIEQWSDNKRDILISYNDKIDKSEFEEHIRIVKCTSHTHISTIIGIVKKYCNFILQKDNQGN